MKSRVFAAALFLSGTLAFAQEAPRAQETIDVTIRNVDLVVTDAKGNRVAGLAKDDLQLFENGTAREITNFSEIKKGATTGTAEPPPRRIAIVFDLYTLTMPAKQQAVTAARKFLNTNLRKSDLAAVYTGGNSLTVISDWSSDPAVIGAALDKVNAEAALPNATQRQLSERRIRDSLIDASFVESAHRAPAAGGGGAGTAPDDSPRTQPVMGDPTMQAPRQSNVAMSSFNDVIAQARIFAQTEYRDVEHSLSVMNAVTAAFGAAGGRKVLIVAGGGLPTRPGAELFTWLQGEADKAARGEYGSAMTKNAGRSSAIDASKYDASPIIRSFAHGAAQKGIVLYALDTEFGGHVSSQVERADRSDSAADYMGVSQRADGYQMLSNLTGGVALLGGSAETAMAEIAKDLDSYYSIAYRTTADASGVSQLNVKSKSGYNVRATFAALPKSRDSEMLDKVAANTIEKQPNDLGITLAADPVVPGEGDRRTVAVRIMIPVKKLKLVKEGDSVTGGFNVYVSTGDDKGNSSEVSKQTHEIKWPADALPALMEKSITYRVNVVMEPGRSQISIGVMDQRSEQRGFERIGV
ncbi:MAG TPA: VWA domain-containing protein [Thermoanaerobaculia bacterium]|nr:VWA domain-containing protein [Thermoanaerobaculia bacterium]